jgi:hypothetical protein
MPSSRKSKVLKSRKSKVLKSRKSKSLKSRKSKSLKSKRSPKGGIGNYVPMKKSHWKDFSFEPYAKYKNDNTFDKERVYIKKNDGTYKGIKTYMGDMYVDYNKNMYSIIWEKNVPSIAFEHFVGGSDSDSD